MRLKCLRLAGFKSFVDPTTIDFPSSMCAVVGPNGCGKSNVIDAVRWVMGESSASYLRGDSITDVIFKGTDTRKEVGQASVELVFDNHDHALSGEYAKFDEVSIRRRVDRDGQSTYLLNGSKVRRKDITDVFLGTGLGARSYSIIEQGMVSRLIESKPEDLRVFIEEAAGISRYKDRRRETENRIRRTRDNLERLSDIREELGRKLQNLKRQSVAAEKYGEFKQVQRQCQANLSGLRWQGLEAEIKTIQGTISQLEIRVEAITAEQRTFETELERHRLDSVGLDDTHNEVLARYYSIGNDVVRLEQSIKHTEERVETYRRDLSETRELWEQNKEGLDSDLRKITRLGAQLEEIKPRWEQARQDAEASASALTGKETELLDLQREWDEFNQRAEEPRQSAEVQQSRIGQLEINIEREKQRQQSLETEQSGLDSLPAESGASIKLSKQIAAQENELDALKKRVGDQLARLQADREALVNCEQAMETASRTLQSEKNQQSSLLALQQAALGKDNPALDAWLADHGLNDRARLAEGISIESGWELAVESVLGGSLQAITAADLDTVAGLLPSLPDGELAFVGPSGQSAEPTGRDQWPTLASKVRSEWSLDELPENIYALDSLDEALARRNELASGESVITAQGIWMGANWIKVSNISKQKSIVERQKKLNQLEAEVIPMQEATCLDLQKTRNRLKHAIEKTERDRNKTQQSLTDATAQLGELKTHFSTLQTKVEEAETRKEQLKKELAVIKHHLETEQRNLAEARSQLEIALDGMARDSGGREKLNARRNEARMAVEHCRNQYRTDNEQAHALALNHQSIESELKSIRLNMDRMASQVQYSKERIESLQSQIRESGEPLENLRRELQLQLESRLEVEQEKNTAKALLDKNEHKIRKLEQARNEKQQLLVSTNATLSQNRILMEGASVKRQAEQDQLQETGFDLKKILAELPAEITEADCAEQLQKISNRIQRLGPINLAAIDEYQQESERKAYLDRQNEDLEKALETLRKAIRKIDKETRVRFKETFEKINEGLKQLFPRLFAGGHAYLDMTGEDLLDTGVAVMARPPGKRNSTIHMLSGGEKAMTAIALVFSIFRLNPSPFCMLDEVDAPLDDDNAVRYINLVKEMSASVQFIFVTHNKITMEKANQLLGVTMHERGVSRIVAVDIDAAVEMASDNQKMLAKEAS